MFGISKQNKTEKVIEVDGRKYRLKFWDEVCGSLTLPYASVSEWVMYRFLFWKFYDWDEFRTFWTEADRIDQCLKIIQERHEGERFTAQEHDRVEKFCKGG